jgi:Bacterial SH3 domain
MLLIDIPVFFFTFGFGLIATNIVCVIWAMIAVNNYNNRVGRPPQVQQVQSPPVFQQQPSFQSPPQFQSFQAPPASPPPVTEPKEEKSETPTVRQHKSPAPVEQQYTASSPATGGANPMLNNAANWITQNLRALLILAGAVLGLAMLILAVKYIVTVKFDKDSPDKPSAEAKKEQPVEKETPAKQMPPESPQQQITPASTPPPTQISIAFKPDAFAGFVKTKQGSDLRLRAEPSESATVLMNIRNFGSVNVLGYEDKDVVVNGEKGHWYKVRYQEQEGWVWGGFIVRK